MNNTIIIFVFQIKKKYEVLQSALKFVSLMKATGRLLLIIPILFNNYILFILFYLLYHILEKGASPTYTSIMKDIYPVEYRSNAMGMVRVELTIFSVLFSLIAGKVYDMLPYRIVFLIAVLIGASSQIFFYKIKQLKDYKTQKARRNRFKIKELFAIIISDKLILIYLSIFFLLGFSNILSATLYPMYIVDVLKISNFKTGTLFGINSFALIIGFYFWGKYIDKNDPLKARIILMFLLSFLPLFYFLSYFSYNYKYIFVIIASFFQGFAMSGGELARVNFFTRIANDEMIEKYWAVDFFLLGIRGIIAPFIAVFLKSKLGFTPVFFTSFLFIFISGILMLLYYKKYYYKLKDRGVIELYSYEIKSS